MDGARRNRSCENGWLFSVTSGLTRRTLRLNAFTPHGNKALDRRDRKVKTTRSPGRTSERESFGREYSRAGRRDPGRTHRGWLFSAASGLTRRTLRLNAFTPHGNKALNRRDRKA